ncbi:MAG: hypothetical protein QNJ85_16335 [Gammaproteobacteria bacterium]|nr:hypothetical protein [Gammaproteobacteria bacterium]
MKKQPAFAKIGPLLLVLASLAGCAAIQAPHREHLEAGDSALRECAHWFRALDRAIAAAGVADIGARRIDGFPYLRVDRFSASFRQQAGDDAATNAAWLQRLRELDVIGRRIEIDNLPDPAVRALDDAGRDALLTRLQECAMQLARVDLPAGEYSEVLARRARVDDDYSSLKRALGLYELTRLPFHAGVENWQERAAAEIEAVRRGKAPVADLLRYRPADVDGYTRAEVRDLLARAARHPLGIAQLSREQRSRLFATYAPVFEIETAGDFDRIGQPYWNGGPVPGIDLARPTVYTRIDYTRVDNRSLLQLVYVAWFPERPAAHWLDLLAGRLDGLAWRVTLAPDGEPVLFDSIHPCGCYHMFFTTPRVEPIAAPAASIEWAFTAASLPRIAAGQRLVVSLQSRTHYLRNAWPAEVDGDVDYLFADYDDLRSLPLPDGGARSLFGEDGLVPGTARGERFLFWPMGIRSAGAMRQAGSQATAFVGRRHFDDPDLVEKRFRLRAADQYPATGAGDQTGD